MSRAAILAAIRRGLRKGPLPPAEALMLAQRLALHPRQLVPARACASGADLVGLFCARLEKEYGTVARLPGPAAVPEAIAAYLEEQNLPAEIVAAPHPELDAIPWGELLRLRRGCAETSDLASLTQAFAGIAETGTLMLPSGPERPTRLNLLADTALVLLRTSRVVGAYEDAWDLLRAERGDPGSGGFMPRCVMLVTGPSRSADIEQILELGAHGPRRLHVLLIEDSAGP